MSLIKCQEHSQKKTFLDLFQVDFFDSLEFHLSCLNLKILCVNNYHWNWHCSNHNKKDCNWSEFVISTAHHGQFSVPERNGSFRLHVPEKTGFWGTRPKKLFFRGTSPVNTSLRKKRSHISIRMRVFKSVLDSDRLLTLRNLELKKLALYAAVVYGTLFQRHWVIFSCLTQVIFLVMSPDYRRGIRRLLMWPLRVSAVRHIGDPPASPCIIRWLLLQSACRLCTSGQWRPSSTLYPFE